MIGRAACGWVAIIATGLYTWWMAGLFGYVPKNKELFIGFGFLVMIYVTCELGYLGLKEVAPIIESIQEEKL